MEDDIEDEEDRTISIRIKQKQLCKYCNMNKYCLVIECESSNWTIENPFIEYITKEEKICESCLIKMFKTQKEDDFISDGE